jgi:predicted nucleic acid-binding protein
LDELGCLPLLSFYNLVYIPNAVWEEIDQHRPSALRRRRPKFTLIEELLEPTLELGLLINALELDRSEIEALSLMQTLSNATLATDDAAARLACRFLGYEVHGTVGIIVAAIHRKQKSIRQVVNLLDSIPLKSTLHIKRSFLNLVIDEVKKGAL